MYPAEIFQRQQQAQLQAQLQAQQQAQLQAQQQAQLQDRAKAQHNSYMAQVQMNDYQAQVGMSSRPVPAAPPEDFRMKTLAGLYEIWGEIQATLAG